MRPKKSSQNKQDNIARRAKRQSVGISLSVVAGLFLGKVGFLNTFPNGRQNYPANENDKIQDTCKKE
jgi:hypothetical protein